MNLIQEYIEFWEIRYENIFSYLLEHLSIAFVSIIFAIIITVPLAIGMTKMKNERLKQSIFNVANFFQTIPTIALFALLIPIFGIGFTPAVVALFLYALLPLLRNTYTGVESIDQGIVEAAKGMGYSTVQRLAKVELSIAVPYIMSGIRITTVYIISWTTLATVIGAGGLGDLVMAGIGSNNTYMIFTGTALAIILALTIEHIVMVLQAMGLALLVGVPLGILAAKVEKVAPVILSLVNILQLIPSLAMLAILLIYFGLGNETVVIGLFFYSLLPIVRNTYVGIKEVDPGVSEAGKGIGMTPLQLLAKVQFPLSIPFLMAGLRVAFVIAVAVATIAPYIGGGGLGKEIVGGINGQNDIRLIAGGTTRINCWLSFRYCGKDNKTAFP